MGFRKFHIFSFIFLLSIVMLSSCIYDDGACHSPENSPSDHEGLTQMILHIKPITTRSEGSSNVVEYIKTLRVIMIDVAEENLGDGNLGDSPDPQPGLDNDSPSNVKVNTIEFNQLITLNTESTATGFFHDFIWYTLAGKKKFYLFANEDSVKEVCYSLSNSENSGDQDPEVKSIENFSEWLQSFENGSPSQEMENILPLLYFTPIYIQNQPEQNVSGNSPAVVYLPYTAFYDDIEVSKNNKDGASGYQDIDMFLVPVATKFTFNFINYRPTPVMVNGISLATTNSQNYIFGNVGSDDMFKTLPDSNQSLYWINWLAAVSELSQGVPGFGQNVGFNQKYGWILDYEIPTDNTENPIFVVPQNPVKIIAGSEPDENEVITPTTTTAGPFYVPESINLIPPESDKQKPQQAYYLTIDFQETVEGNLAPEFNNVHIENLNALFRNTHVIINITLRKGDILVYAEIADWNQKTAKGYVSEETDPSDSEKPI